ncbi:hypothetical protein TRVA0_006S03004 [Trichomonascus vanleenenianus]|uniref:uncharacterized protein n=1 Tax=Trichomonascus vanleenenianus TaxID=2268995 RepID=UPI003EC9AC17
MSTTEAQQGEVDYEEALKRLDELQARSQRLRFDLPNVLRGLAHIDERQAPNAVFAKVVQDIHAMGGDIEQFNEMYRNNDHVLNFGRKEKSAVLQQSNLTPGATTNNMIPMNNAQTNNPQNRPVMGGNNNNNNSNNTAGMAGSSQSPQSIISRMANANGNGSVPPSTRDSGMDGMTQDQPIVLDDSGMNFVQF